MKTINHTTPFTNESFGKVYKAHWPRLYSVARKFVDDQQAEQLVENIFVELWFTKTRWLSIDVEERLMRLLKSSIYEHFERLGQNKALIKHSSVSESMLLVNKPC